MRVLVFNSSPQMDKGNTALILNPFNQGMKKAGAEVVIILGNITLVFALAMNILAATALMAIVCDNIH